MASRPRAGLARLLAVAGIVMCVVEQANVGPSIFDDRAAAKWLAHASDPPPLCRAFYLLPSAGAERRLPWTIRDSDAMVLSQLVRLPTINGNSSWFPPGWDLFDPDSPDYAARVKAWLDQHPVAGICGVGPRDGRWVIGPPAS